MGSWQKIALENVVTEVLSVTEVFPLIKTLKIRMVELVVTKWDTEMVQIKNVCPDERA